MPYEVYLTTEVEEALRYFLVTKVTQDLRSQYLVDFFVPVNILSLAFRFQVQTAGITDEYDDQ